MAKREEERVGGSFRSLTGSRVESDPETRRAVARRVERAMSERMREASPANAMRCLRTLLENGCTVQAVKKGGGRVEVTVFYDLVGGHLHHDAETLEDALIGAFEREERRRERQEEAEVGG